MNVGNLAALVHVVIQCIAQLYCELIFSILFALLEKSNNAMMLIFLIFCYYLGCFLQIKQPILFLSGLQDEMVPPSHMQMLYAKAAARNKHCKFVEFPTGMHMDTWLAGGDQYWTTIQQFLAEHVPEEKENESYDNGILSLQIFQVIIMQFTSMNR